jgi:hypothetical protein
MDIIIKSEKPFEVSFEDLSGKIRRVLVHHKGSFYMVSENTALKETLIFPASPTGEIESWSEVGGGKGITLEEVLVNFEQELFGYF